MDKEKKVTLDELPDEDPESSVPVAHPIAPKKSVDPRLLKIKNLDEDDRMELMQQRWLFDDPDWLFGWLIYGLGLVSLQLSTAKNLFVQKVEELPDPADLKGMFFHPVLFLIEFLLTYPTILFVLAPLIFKLRIRSENYFEVTFDGISAPRKIQVKLKEMPTRVFIKWAEITKVDAFTSRGKKALRLSANDGPLGELVWDLTKAKKKALKIILNGLIPKDHALQVFLAKDIK